jgi:hypothetical protein
MLRQFAEDSGIYGVHVVGGRMPPRPTSSIL